jgi:hypothetical protein
VKSWNLLGSDDQLEVTETGIKITMPARFTGRSGALVALNSTGGNALQRVRHDAALSTSLLRSEAWKRRLLLGKAATIEDLACDEGVAASCVMRGLRVAFLAPDLKRAILDGSQPDGLTLQRVLTQAMPFDWRRQREPYRS